MEADVWLLCKLLGLILVIFALAIRSRREEAEIEQDERAAREWGCFGVLLAALAVVFVAYLLWVAGGMGL